MSTQKIAVSTLWQLGSQITMAALSILTVKFVAVGLSKELAGNYNSAYGFLQLFGILADFGLYAVAVREVSKAKDRGDVLGALVILRALILLLSLGSAIVIVWMVPMWKGTPLPLGVTIAALVPLFGLLAGMLRTVFQVTYKMQYVFIAEVSQRILTVSLIGIFIALGVRGSTDLSIYHTFLLIGGVGSLLLFTLSLFFALRLVPIRLRWNGELMGRLARAAAPFGIAYLCIALYRQLDVTLIALLRPDYEIQNAYYGFVLRMADMGFLIPTFLLNSTLPILSERDSAGQKTDTLLGKTLLMILIFGSISFLFSIMWSRPLVALLTTEQYLSTPLHAGSDTALQLLAPSFFLNGIVLFGFYILLAKGKWQSLVGMLLVGVAVSLLLNMYLIPSYGFVGAAITSVLVHAVLAVPLLVAGTQTMNVYLPLPQLRRWLTFSLLLATSLWLLLPILVGEFFTVIGIIIATILMGISFYFSGLSGDLLKN